MTSKKKIVNPLAIEQVDGIGPVTAKNLREEGITSIFDIVVRGPVRIKEILGWTTEEAVKAVQSANAILQELDKIDQPIQRASDMLTKNREYLKTGSDALDVLLTGGIELGSVTEFYGQFASGKTQTCLTLTVNAMLPVDQGGLDGGVLYIDTENTFKAERIIPIAEAKGLDPVKVLDNIFHAKAYNFAHQILLLEQAGEMILKDNIKLIIIDSIVGNSRPEFVGRGSLAERQQLMNNHIHILSRMCDTYNIAGVVTNQVVSSPDNNMFSGDPMKATGGNVIAHGTTYRVKLAPSGKNRIASLVDSPKHAFSQVKFTITEAGVKDVEDYKQDEDYAKLIAKIEEVKQRIRDSRSTEDESVPAEVESPKETTEPVEE